jgi:hypothetical protein
MHATAILSAPLELRLPALVLPDTRPTRGKHRARRSLAAALGAWQRARVECSIVVAGAGAVLAAVLS